MLEPPDRRRRHSTLSSSPTKACGTSLTPITCRSGSMGSWTSPSLPCPSNSGTAPTLASPPFIPRRWWCRLCPSARSATSPPSGDRVQSSPGGPVSSANRFAEAATTGSQPIALPTAAPDAREFHRGLTTMGPAGPLPHRAMPPKFQPRVPAAASVGWPLWRCATAGSPEAVWTSLLDMKSGSCRADTSALTQIDPRTQRRHGMAARGPASLLTPVLGSLILTPRTPGTLQLPPPV